MVLTEAIGEKNAEGASSKKSSISLTASENLPKDNNATTTSVEFMILDCMNNL